MVDLTPAMNGASEDPFYPRGLVQRRYYITRKNTNVNPEKKKRILPKQHTPANQEARKNPPKPVARYPKNGADYPSPLPQLLITTPSPPGPPGPEP